MTHSNKCTKIIYVVFADGVSRKSARALIHTPCNNMFLVLIYLFIYLQFLTVFVAIIYLLLRWKLCVDFRFYMLKLYILVKSAIPVILKFSEFFFSLRVVGRPYLIVIV